MAVALGGCSQQKPEPRTAKQPAAAEPAPATDQTAPEKKEPSKAETHEVSPAKNEPAKPDETSAKPAQTAAQKPAASAADETDDMDAQVKKPRDLGPPLVEHVERLIPLDPKQPVWVDRDNKQVILVGEVCRADYPLEFFATYSNRSYEAVMAINVTPFLVHTGLLAVGAEPGRPAQFQPQFTPPTGTEVAIEVRWRDAAGKVQSAPAQHWIRNIQTKKELDANWVFAGSMLMKDEQTGKQQYLADSGELICTLNLPTAMLDLPLRSYSELESRLFEAFTEHLPPPGTPTTVVLKPLLSAKPNEPHKPQEPTPPQ